MARRRKADKQLVSAARKPSAPAGSDRLLDDVRNLIQQARTTTAQAVNAVLVLLYWEVGRRIRIDILKSSRATYGNEICSTLSNELVAEFGTRFSRPNLTRMIRFAEVFPDRDIVTTLSAKLGWNWSRAGLLKSGHLMQEGKFMATVWGVVKDGLIAPSSPLPDGTRVEIRPCETLPEVPPELQEELDAWQRAGAEALELVERLAQEMEANEKR